MNMNHIYILIPLLIYLSIVILLAVFVRTRHKSKKTVPVDSFFEEYFIGGRSMGSLTLAMAIITSYTSASSFIGGPGLAYDFGLSWVLIAMIQIPAGFFVLGVLGKRFAFVARKIRSVTLIDFLRARYQSEVVAVLCAVGMVVFFILAILAQFIGGAKLFQVVTGYSYQVGLVLFGLVGIFYTAFGGFRAVVITDVLQGFVMISAAIVMIVAVIVAGGGVETCIAVLQDIDVDLVTVRGPNGVITAPMAMSFWVLIGLGTLGLPQTLHKCMGYKDSQSMHHAMILGTIIMGFMVLSIHLAGAFGRVVCPNLPTGDLIMPSLAIELLPPVWAGIFIAGPLAAIMSTVDTMLLLISGVLIKDIYMYYSRRRKILSGTYSHIESISRGCTAVIGIIVFVAALNPPSLLVWINLFAFGGLEVVFLWPVVFGLYWKKANALGVTLSIAVGLITFIVVSFFVPFTAGVHAVVPALFLSLIAFCIGVFFGRPSLGEVTQILWGNT